MSSKFKLVRHDLQKPHRSFEIMRMGEIDVCPPQPLCKPLILRSGKDREMSLSTYSNTIWVRIVEISKRRVISATGVEHLDDEILRI